MTLYETKRIFDRFSPLALVVILLFGLAFAAPKVWAEQRYLDQIFTEVGVQAGIQYGAGVRPAASGGAFAPQALYMDVYSPSDDTLSNRPVIVLAFPGGFVDGARDNPEMVWLARQFAMRGYVAASIDYRLIENSPDTSQELQINIVQAVHDMRAAVRFFREDAATGNQFGTSGENIFVGGISAGAVMAAITAVLDDGDDLPNSVLDYLAENGGMDGNSSANTQFSSRVSGVLQISGAIRRLSWIEPGDPPIYAAHEEFDPVVPCDTLPGIAFIEFGLALTSSGACDMIPAARAVGVPAELFLDENSLSHVGFSDSELAQIMDDSAAFFFNEVLQPRTLASAVLPASRSVQVGQPATVFASVVNAADTDATGCVVSMLTPVPANFSYELTDANNASLSIADSAFTIPAGEVQNMVLSFEPDEAFAPTDTFLEFKCEDGAAAAATLGLNSVLLAADENPVADIIGLTTVVDLQADIDSTTLFAVGSANVGAAADIRASAVASGLPVLVQLCQTNPATGACMGEVDTSVELSFSASSTASFAVFATPNASIANDPAVNRIFIRFTDSDGVVRGSTSTAIRTQ